MKSQTTFTFLFTLLFLLFAAGPLTAQTTWLDWDTAQLRNKKEQRQVLVYVYGSNCSFCPQMDSVYADTSIGNYLDKTFYPVRLKLEEQSSMSLAGREYNYVRNKSVGGYHELAAQLLEGQLSLPALVILGQDGRILQSMTGFKNVDEVRHISRYFGEGFFRKMPWSSYAKKVKIEEERREQ